MAERHSLISSASAGRRLEQLAVAMLAALLVYALYYPADSIAVELGQAIYFCGAALLFGWVSWVARPAIDAWRAERWSLLLDVSVWALAGWMALACWANASQINLRMAVNETWLWFAAAAIVTGVRRSVVSSETRTAFVFLMVAAGAGLAAHGWHQLEVSLPADRARYEADPEAVLRAVGINPIDAPPGSAQRMNFVNRLYDGGPTATFALANSLAALLLISWVLAFGILLRRGRLVVRMTRSATDWGFLAIAAVAVAILGMMLLRSHSRSAVGSAVLVASGFLVYEVAGGESAAGRRMRTRLAAWKKGLAAVAVGCTVLVVGGGLWVASRGELLERALPSVLFRFQYWRSTLALAAKAPWFGCGPGNFQACYEAYRELSASEQIADPHNWLMETLAAGGFPAAVILGFAIFSLSKASGREGTETKDDALPEPTVAHEARQARKRAGERRRVDAAAPGSAGSTAAVWLGAGLGLFAVWSVGLLIGWLPDLGAHFFAVPLAGLVLVGLWRCRPSGLELRAVVIAALLAVMLHLSFSGGWTVPGVALPIWILAASMVPVSSTSLAHGRGRLLKTDASRKRAGDRAAGRPRFAFDRLVALLVGAVLLFLIQKTAISPIQRLTVETRHASAALAQGRLDQAKLALQRAAESDPWNPHPVRDLAALQQIELLELGGDDLPSRDRQRDAVAKLFDLLDQSERETLRRSPHEPALWRYFGRQRLHLYQRWGRHEDLEIALQRLKRGFELAPAQEAVAAQIALIEQHQGRFGEAEAWARRAQRLAEAGGHIERGLDRAIVLTPEKLGELVREQPRQLAASDALANLLEN